MVKLEIDLSGAKELAKGLQWLSSLGESDTKKVRDELQDLLLHCSQTLKSFVQLAEVLYEIKKEAFNTESFLDVFFHCSANYTSPEGARKARSHCTDIQRDIQRIKFKLAKVLRSELGQWSSVDEDFSKLVDADEDFLDSFETDMERVQRELEQILELIESDTESAWERYESLRTSLIKSVSGLRKELRTMERAENHIRRMLT